MQALLQLDSGDNMGDKDMEMLQGILVVVQDPGGNTEDTDMVVPQEVLPVGLRVGNRDRESMELFLEVLLHQEGSLVGACLGRADMDSQGMAG